MKFGAANGLPGSISLDLEQSRAYNFPYIDKKDVDQAKLRRCPNSSSSATYHFKISLYALFLSAYQASPRKLDGMSSVVTHEYHAPLIGTPPTHLALICSKICPGRIRLFVWSCTSKS
jgi:hypothetical protein